MPPARTKTIAIVLIWASLVLGVTSALNWLPRGHSGACGTVENPTEPSGLADRSLPGDGELAPAASGYPSFS